MAKTTVVKISEPFDVYIGRSMPYHSYGNSPWGNPFRITNTRTREEAIAQFRHWLMTSDSTKAKWMREHLHLIRGKRLGCWCAPLPCHGDVLAEMADKAVSE